MQATSFSARIFFGIVSIVPLWATLSWGVDVGAPHSYNMRPLVVPHQEQKHAWRVAVGSPHPYNSSPVFMGRPVPPRTLHAGVDFAIISNGTVQLGVNKEGHLNVPGGTPSSGTGTTFVGLRFVPTNAESTAPGCLCEGWGAGDNTSQVSGYANVAVDGVVNLTVESFVSDATTATSTVRVGETLRVTHFYHPSDTPNLYQVDVTIENVSGAPVELLYRRVMDWDVEPTAFDEFVTIKKGTAADIAFTSNNGFATANP